MDKTCETCQKAFYVSPSRPHIKNCSYECNKIWRKNIQQDRAMATKDCECGCGSNIKMYKGTKLNRYINGHQNYARRKPKIIKTNHQIGKNHWNWKGGITTEDKKLRLKFRKTMQMKIFARDNYTCQVCDIYGSNIQVDHIKSWKDYPELRFDMKNCRTLCMACHYYVTFKRKLPNGVVWGHNLSRRIES